MMTKLVPVFTSNVDSDPVPVRFQTNVSEVIRTETFESQEHLVAPVVMITEGVHNGLYYPEEELQKFPMAWNSRCVPVFHPEDLEGRRVPVGSPRVIEANSIGMVFNTKWDAQAKKLRAELWLNKAKMEALEAGRVVLEALDAGTMIEVSTGLFLEEDSTSGVWNAEDYRAVARNYRPDHLALLPGKKGACSTDDGAGFPRTNQQEEPSRGLFAKMREWYREHFGTNRDNSLDQRRRQICDLLQARFGNSNTYIWVEDLLEESVVYEVDSPDGMHLFKLPYAIGEDGSPILVEVEPISVERVIQYEPVTNGKEKEMNREQMIKSLIESGKWNETDREFLTTLSDEQLGKVVGTPAEAPAPEAPATPPVDNEEKPSAAIQMSWEDLKKVIPADMLTALESSKAQADAQQAKLVAALVANARCQLTEDELKPMSLVTLQKLHASMTPTGSQLFLGNDPGNPIPTTVDTNEAPPPMEWDWSKDAVATVAE